jgi:DNA polymerase III alpha subunit
LFQERVLRMALRLGLHRLKGLSAGTMGRLVAAREVAGFGSVEDLAERVGPTLKERRVLAAAGALNALPEVGHRRQAMWQVELPFHGDLLADGRNDAAGVLPAMSVGERVAADFSVQGATTGPHPMRLWRENCGTRGVQRARDLAVLPTGVPVVVAGMAICRQRPGDGEGALLHFTGGRDRDREPVRAENDVPPAAAGAHGRGVFAGAGAFAAVGGGSADGVCDGNRAAAGG